MQVGEIPKVGEVQPLDEEILTATLEAIEAEVYRQDMLARAGHFGGYHILPSGPDYARLAVLSEEVGEIARELNERLIRGFPETQTADLEKELVQVGACAAAWLTALRQPKANA